MLARGFRASKAFVKIVVCIAVFTDVFLYGLVVPMLPYALSERLGLPDDSIQRWNSILLGTYGAAILLGSLFFGWVGDQMRSRQTPFVLGLLVLGGATGLFAMGTSLVVLMIARILQGASTAIVFTVGFALLFDKVGKDQIGEAMGYSSMSLSLGLFLGPILGGLVYEYAGYFPVFIPAFVLIALEIMLRFLVIEEDRYSNGKQPLLHNENAQPRYGATQTSKLPSAPCTTNTEDADVQVQRESDPQNIRSTDAPKSAVLVLLKSPRLLVAMIGLFAINSVTTAFEGVLPVYVKELFHVNSLHAALLFFSITIPMLLSPLTGKLVDRAGVKWPAVAGFGLASPSLVCLRLVAHNTTHDMATLCTILFCVGCGVAFAMPPMMTEVTFAVEEQERREPGVFGPHGAYAQAYGLTNAAFAGGALIGPLYAGFLRVHFSWATMSLVMGCLSTSVAVLCLAVTGGKLVKFRGTMERDADHTSTNV